MRYPTVFQPCRIGSLNIKNRLVMSQMTMNYATEEGVVTDRLIDHYAARAAGGVGLVVVEGSYFTREGKGYVRQIGLVSRKQLVGLKRLTKAVHGLQNETRIFLQIHHAGGRASSKVTGVQPVAPSAVFAYPGAEMPWELTRKELLGLIEAHAEAAGRAADAGFDGVDIHCAHGYLIPSFFSARTNQRIDEYGGDLVGRSRFLVEIIRAVRKRVGEDFPLTIKISGDEYIDGGLGIPDMIVVARLAQAAGINGLFVSAGTVGDLKSKDLNEAHKVMRTLPMMTRPGCLVPIAEAFKEALHIPVVAVGRINTIELAEEILAKGRADMVAIGRPLLADPELPNKAAAGREQEIRPCIACNEGCYKRILQQQEVRCSVNPLLGRDAETAARKVGSVKRVVAVGAGPAGVEAACRAAERGHAVTLIEKDPAPGGQLLLAAVPPGRGEIGRYIDYMALRLAQSGVDVRLGEKVCVDAVRRLRPDAVILATGAEPHLLTVPGLRAGQGLTAWDVLSGKCAIKGPLLVVGGGLVGCETADYLSDRGEKVTVVEVLSAIASDADKDTKAYFEMRFQKNGVRVHAGASLIGIDGNDAIIRQGDAEERVEAAMVVFAVGAKPENCLYDQLVAAGFAVVQAGDCLKPRRLLDSVEEGFLAGDSV